jgi:hypothetical protein
MKKKKGKIQSQAEWWEEHREQFERTERHYEELKAKWAQEDGARAPGKAAAEDAA